MYKRQDEKHNLIRGNDISMVFQEPMTCLNPTMTIGDQIVEVILNHKKISKTNAVQSQLEKELPTDDVHIGPSDHVPWLEDRKWAYIRLEGTSWGDVPLNVELKLEVEDSPNSAGVAIDAIRCAKIALDKGVSGAIDAPSAYFMKSPPNQMRDDDARKAVEDFSGLE